MYIFKNKNIFRHLKLEIALAIPASNDEKYNSNNLAGQGLTFLKNLIFHFLTCQQEIVIHLKMELLTQFPPANISIDWK